MDHAPKNIIFICLKRFMQVILPVLALVNKGNIRARQSNYLIMLLDRQGMLDRGEDGEEAVLLQSYIEILAET